MPAFGITGVVTSPLGITGANPNYTMDGVSYEYAIDGLPFAGLATTEMPIERALAPIRKQQVDQSDQPGEQSLDSWWLRSQTDWSGGAGLSFMEPASDARVQRGFSSSAGVNPWTIGQVSMLKALTSQRTLAGSAASYVCKYSATGGMYFGSGSNIDRYNGSTWASTTGFSGTLAQLLVAGSKILAVNTSGAIYSAAAGDTTLSALWTTSSGATRSWWVKQRLITAQGPDLFELGLAGGNLDSETPYYTHPDSGWTWTAAVEAPGAILVAGYGAAGSAIYKFLLTDGGELPTISGAITTAELPVGEYITDAVTYLGSFIAIATNLGVRVGAVGQNGDVTYGPFTYEGATLAGFAPFSRFVYIGVADAGEGRSGLIRIDLSDIGDDGRAPWANDLRMPSGEADDVQSFVVFEEDEAYLATTGTLYGCTSASDLEAEGFLTTGYVRYGTIEKKNFDSLRVELTSPVDGLVIVSSVQKDGTETTIGSYGSDTDLDEPISISVPTLPQRHLALKFSFYRDTVDATVGPVLELWQMRAVPAPNRAELQQIPLMCFDFERDQYGQLYGYEGAAHDRYVALRDAVRGGRSVRLQNFSTGETTVCVVEELSFRQSAPPVRASGFGGVVLLTVRSL